MRYRPSSDAPARCPSSACCSLRSIAIVGASADPRAFGDFVQANLERFGYEGQMHLVSRSSAEINGRACVQDDRRAAGGHRPRGARHSGGGRAGRRQGLGGATLPRRCLFASGYAEAGDEGHARQQALAATAREAGIAAGRSELHGLHQPRRRRARHFRAPAPDAVRETRPGVGRGRAKRRHGSEPARCVPGARRTRHRGLVHRQRGRSASRTCWRTSSATRRRA